MESSILLTLVQPSRIILLIIQRKVLVMTEERARIHVGSLENLGKVPSPVWCLAESRGGPTAVAEGSGGHWASGAVARAVQR